MLARCQCGENCHIGRQTIPPALELQVNASVEIRPFDSCTKPGPTAGEIRLGPLRSENDGTVVVGQAHLPVADSAPAYCRDRNNSPTSLGSELKGHVEIVDRMVALALFFAEPGAGGVGRGEAGVEPDGRVIIFQRTVTHPEPREHLGAVEVGYALLGASWIARLRSATAWSYWPTAKWARPRLV